MRIPLYVYVVTVRHAGCAAPLATTHALIAPATNASTPSVETSADDLKSKAVRKATTEPPTQEQALAGIFDELEKIRAIDPEAQRQVMEDLRNAKPEHYAMIVDAFAKALAYRQQLARRELESSAPEAPWKLEKPSASLAAGPDKGHSLEQVEFVSASAAAATSQNPGTVPRDPIAATSAVVKGPTATGNEEFRATPPTQGSQLKAIAKRSDAAAAVEQLEAKALPEPIVATAVVASDENPTSRSIHVVQASTVATDDWQADLRAAIADLERTLSPTPTNTAELHDHMRLRTLQLLVGREEDAYRPIPGASPAQQDYWSKQLFAMAAYLNSGGKLDDKQRAAAALAPFDEARAKLSELATLQIRNAAFVASVDGYGSYELRKQTPFQPGQKVTLYVEVENFTSNSAEDGYHTSLATSYQLLDSNRRRVDAKQFPDVADKCRNRRRDFHMQYEFALPTRIYPGDYELELTITDHNSGKIGQASIPFQVAGDAKP